jgi:hypothetical protein
MSTSHAQVHLGTCGCSEAKKGGGLTLTMDSRSHEHSPKLPWPLPSHAKLEETHLMMQSSTTDAICFEYKCISFEYYSGYLSSDKSRIESPHLRATLLLRVPTTRILDLPR